MADETENPDTEPTPSAGTSETASPAPEETPAAEATPAADETPAAEDTTAAEPEVILTPKERRQRRRTAAVRKRGARRAANPEERAAERKRKADQRRRYRAKLKERRAGAPKAEHEQGEHARTESTGHKKVRQGVVVSDKADKTITVRLEVVRRHRRYHKTIRTSQTLHAHDERNDAHVGDTVRVVEARPLSRTKRWRLLEVVERAR